MDQIRAWKDAEASGGTDSEHPAGEVELPVTRGQIARTMVLAGMVLGCTALGTAVVPTVTTKA